MYTDINTGAFFEYNGIPVIIDSRIDMYDKELLQDMNAIKGKVSVTDGTPDYTEAVLEKYNIDMVTLCRGDSMMLIGYMSQKQNWRITYQDSAYVIFQKAQEWFSICFYDLTKRYVILIFERVSVTNSFKKRTVPIVFDDSAVPFWCQLFNF